VNSADSEEERLQALLAEAGRRPQLPEAKKKAWEALFRRELGTIVTARRQRRRTFYAATAAVMVGVAGVLLLLGPPLQQSIVVAEIVSAVHGNQTFRNGAKIAPLIEGSKVHVGQTVRTAAQGTLALAYRNADVRLHTDTTVRFDAARIELIKGSIYVDTGTDHQHGALPVIITTPLGSFSHLGTQFMVAVDDAHEVMAAVREGSIILRTQHVQQNFTASQDMAQLIRISGSGAIETEQAERHGQLWAWVVASSPGRVIDGLSAHEVLGWIARELGLRLAYANKEVRQVATENSMHAPNIPVGPRQALSQVRATFESFQVDDSAGVELLVSPRD